MPYHVAKSSKCPTAKPWAVIKDSDGSVMGCHPSKGAAGKQLAALYANEPSAKADGAYRVTRLEACPVRNAASEPASRRTSASQEPRRYR